MLFNSLDFAIFFPVVTVAYYLLPSRYRPFLLLAASFYFYMAFIPVYVLILLVLITVDYFAGICIEGSQGHVRRVYLTLSILANVGMLSFFKYYNFLNDTLVALVHPL